MLAVDTNVLVRLLVRDEPKQSARAEHLFRSEEIWIAKTVLLETEWILRSLYKQPSRDIERTFRAVAGLPNVRLEDAPAIGQALDWFAAGLDFSDALHVASLGAAGSFATFDAKLAKRAAKLGIDSLTLVE